ncbi:polyribonucleotide nucleotidyltransferase [Candidatus Deianiraea vastatrix]|uniref:Polyribonucleotide nucleotidyltransferase n=1 Tax=Candidatus Deianiraea vastatrix TaxID=2163644 RepID=A0A5B8XJA8_9RICK|nr:polyribonucleotide nucleotidyltransferase [Candidatus Deianiraea vastatrix]QED23914.1 Polyribonucleotide nucleotidyltransferase [Candidatus Deianiraea vastatrix]
MFKTTRKEFEIGNKKYYLETGKLAKQADSAVLCGCGDTQVLCTVVFAKDANPEASFFPLSVTYIEKFYAFGKIPGGYLKREGKASDKETLTSRLIDRPIRPMFPENFYNEVQVICTLISYDKENDPDMVALIGASAALKLAGLPLLHTVAGAKIGFINGEFVVNPSQEQLISKENKLDLTVAATKSSILMVESQAHEINEEQMLKALDLAQKSCIPAINAIDELAKECGNPLFEAKVESDAIKDAKAKILSQFKDQIIQNYTIREKKDRYKALNQMRDKIKEIFAKDVEEGKFMAIELETAISCVEASIVRANIIEKKTRIDGRNPQEIRPIYIETGLLPRSHGSALFCRGETQAMVVATLGAPIDAQMFDSIDGVQKDQFMLHYNFPPFSVGEIAGLRGPGRREIGHGKLAWKAIYPMLDLENCQYTIRVVSEILACNGSSSMASVCGASLSLMDAGIAIKKQVAGIAMGLIKEGDKFEVLTDIMGDEDHLGDMDFKVAGTVDGITALQMDIKIDGISQEILTKALEDAKKARLFLIEKMDAIIAKPKTEISAHAPQVITFSISSNSIGDVIGKGGSNIKQLCEEYKCKIDISENGLVTIYAESLEKGNAAKENIVLATTNLEFGKTYEGTIVELKAFGAMVKLPGNKQGMIHISEIASVRVNEITDYLEVGQVVQAKYLGTDDKRRIKLSVKEMNLPSKVDPNLTKEQEDAEKLIDKRFSSESGVDILHSNDVFYSN